MAWEKSLEAFAFRRGSSHKWFVAPTAAVIESVTQRVVDMIMPRMIQGVALSRGLSNYILTDGVEHSSLTQAVRTLAEKMLEAFAHLTHESALYHRVVLIFRAASAGFSGDETFWVLFMQKVLDCLVEADKIRRPTLVANEYRTQLVQELCGIDSSLFPSLLFTRLRAALSLRDEAVTEEYVVVTAPSPKSEGFSQE